MHTPPVNILVVDDVPERLVSIEAILNELGELILARLSPRGYEEDGRAPIVGKTWAPPAFSGQDVFARNDTEIVRVEVLSGG